MNTALIRYFQCIRNKGIQSAQKHLEKKTTTYKQMNKMIRVSILEYSIQ